VNESGGFAEQMRAATKAASEQVIETCLLEPTLTNSRTGRKSRGRIPTWRSIDEVRD
jgi:hypothetical protein